MSAKKFNTPFALLGDKVEIPTTAQTDGSVSFQQGYPFGYELDYTDPNTKDISRSKTNQLLFDITNAIREIQQGGVSEWSEEGKPYKINSLVYAPDGTVKQSLIANNNNDTTHSSWSNLINASILPTILDNISALPIGTILNAYTIFDNCIVAFGGELNRADYPKLWDYLQANPTLLKTQAQWQAQVTANGGICGFYSDGNGTTTFRVPSLSGATAKFTNRGVGSYEEDLVKSHKHTMRFSAAAEGSGSYSDSQSFLIAQNDVSYGTVTNANAVQATGSTENTVRNIAVLPLIVAK